MATIKQIKDSNGTIHDIIDTTYSAATTTAAGLMSATDKTKLNGIADNANNYSLPIASSSTLGGIKVGRGIEIDSSGVLNHSISEGYRHIPSGGSSGQYLKYSASGTATWADSECQFYDYGNLFDNPTITIASLPTTLTISGNIVFVEGGRLLIKFKNNLESNLRGVLNNISLSDSSIINLTTSTNSTTGYSKSHIGDHFIDIIMYTINDTKYGFVINNENLSNTANYLSTTRYIDGVGFNGGSNITHYASCTTAANTAAKITTITGFSLITGATAIIKFTNGNTSSSPTLNINSTGAKNIYSVSDDLEIGAFDAGVYLLVYDGSCYRMIFTTNAVNAVNAINATKIKVQQSSHTQYMAVTLASNTYTTSTSNAASNTLIGGGTNTGGGYSDLYTAGVTKKPLLYSPFVGNLYVGNATLQVSDERLKDFENDVVIDFDKLKQIPKKYFTWKSDDEKILNIGTSAQELENIYPELVNEYPEGDEVYKTVNYANLSIIALAAIDKLNERIEYLENKIKELEQA